MSFPVSVSTLSAQHLVPFLTEKYGRKDVRCRLIKAGVNHTYRVDADGGCYVFRIYCRDWRSETEIREELRLLAELKALDIPVSEALPDISGNYIQQLDAPEGTRFAVLFSYAEGEKVLHYPPELHEQAGRLMAQIHAYTQNRTIGRTSYTAKTLLEEPFEKLKAFIPADTEEMQVINILKNDILERFRSEDTEQLRRGIVHLDIWFDNFNISPEGEITLFDFDFCGNGWLCLDIAYYLMQLYVLEPEEKAFREKATRFLAGYEQLLPLPAAEKRWLRDLGISLYFFYLGVQCSRFEDWSNVFLNETYLKRYIRVRIQKYAEEPLHERFPDIFV